MRFLTCFSCQVTDIPDAVPGAVPISLNGVVAPASAQKGEMLKGSLDKLMRLYQNSMQKMRVGIAVACLESSV